MGSSSIKSENCRRHLCAIKDCLLIKSGAKFSAEKIARDYGFVLADVSNLFDFLGSEGYVDDRGKYPTEWSATQKFKDADTDEICNAFLNSPQRPAYVEARIDVIRASAEIMKEKSDAKGAVMENQVVNAGKIGKIRKCKFLSVVEALKEMCDQGGDFLTTDQVVEKAGISLVTVMKYMSLLRDNGYLTVDISGKPFKWRMQKKFLEAKAEDINTRLSGKKKSAPTCSITDPKPIDSTARNLDGLFQIEEGLGLVEAGRAAIQEIQTNLGVLADSLPSQKTIKEILECVRRLKEQL